MAITTTTITYRPSPVARRPSPIAHNTNTNGDGDGGNTPQPWHGHVAAPRPARPTTMPTTTTPSPVTRRLSPAPIAHSSLCKIHPRLCNGVCKTVGLCIYPCISMINPYPSLYGYSVDRYG